MKNVFFVTYQFLGKAFELGFSFNSSSLRKIY